MPVPCSTTSHMSHAHQLGRVGGNVACVRQLGIRPAFQQRDRHPRAVADQAAGGVQELQRRHRDAMAESGGRHGDVGPFLGCARPHDLGDLDRGRGVEAHPVEEFLEQRPAPGGEGQPRGTDVGGIFEDLRHRQPAVLGVIVADAVATDLQLAGGVELVRHADLTRVQGGGDGEDLEHRAQLVRLGDVAVEVLDPLARRRPGWDRNPAG